MTFLSRRSHLEPFLDNTIRLTEISWLAIMRARKSILRSQEAAKVAISVGGEREMARFVLIRLLFSRI